MCYNRINLGRQLIFDCIIHIINLKMNDNNFVLELILRNFFKKYIINSKITKRRIYLSFYQIFISLFFNKLIGKNGALNNNNMKLYFTSILGLLRTLGFKCLISSIHLIGE